MKKIYVVCDKKIYPNDYKKMVKDIPLKDRIFGIIIQDTTFNVLNDMAYVLSMWKHQMPEYSKYGFYFLGRELANIALTGAFHEYYNTDVVNRPDIIAEITDMVKATGLKINPKSFMGCVNLAKRVTRMCHPDIGEIFDDNEEVFDVVEDDDDDGEEVRIYVKQN
jgi:hypothetical protein